MVSAKVAIVVRNGPLGINIPPKCILVMACLDRYLRFQNLRLHGASSGVINLETGGSYWSVGNDPGAEPPTSAWCARLATK